MKMCFSQISGCFGENFCFSGKKETCCALLTVEDKCSIAPQSFCIFADTTATCARRRAARAGLWSTCHVFLVSCAYSPFGPFVRSDVSGMQVLWGRPCLVLEPVRAFAFGQGVRAPTLGGVRPGDRLPERVAGSGIPHSTYQVNVPLVGRP